jgi:fructose transport system ATP-binding protein
VSTETRQPILQAKGLVKRYGHVTAIDGADFELYPGEILAVIGDNGAGKSSMIKALSGATIPDSGEIFLDGKPAKFRSPLDARLPHLGHRDRLPGPRRRPALDIATNLFLGREQRRKGPLGSVLRIVDKADTAGDHFETSAGRQLDGGRPSPDQSADIVGDH